MGQFFGGVRCFVKVTEEILAIDPDFTVVYSVTWPLDGSESGGDLVLRQTLLLLFCKSSCFYAS